MSKPAKIQAKPLLSPAKATISMVGVLILMLLYFSQGMAVSSSDDSSVYVHISSNGPFGGVLIAIQPTVYSADAFADGIAIPALILPFSCLFEDMTNGTAACMTVFSLASGTTVHLHGIKQGYYFLRVAAYANGGITTADELVNITSSSVYYVTATFLHGNLSFTSLTPGLQVTSP